MVKSIKKGKVTKNIVLPKRNKINLIDFKENLCQVPQNGILFAVLNDKYENVIPFVACKDYLNDFIWAEKFNKTSPAIYGFSHTPVGILKKNKTFKISICISKSQKLDKIYPIDVYFNKIGIFINKVEELLGFKYSTFELLACDNFISINVSQEWISRPYLFSMYLLFLRIATTYDEKEDVKSFITTYPNKVSDDNSSLIKGSLPLILETLNKKFHKQDYLESDIIHTIHNVYGVVNFCKQLKADNVIKN